MLRLWDFLLGISVALVWGVGIVFAKAAIEHFPPILLMALRFSVTALALMWFFKMPRNILLPLTGIAFISAAVQYSLTFTGLTRLDAGLAGLIVQLEVPFLTLLGAILLKEHTSFVKWIGMLLAFIGVYFISNNPTAVVDIYGILLIIGGAFSWALGQVFIRKLKDIDGKTLTAWIAILATPQLYIMSFIFESGQIQAIKEANWVVWSTVIYLGLIMTALGYGMWYSLIRRNPVSKVAPFLLLLPIFTMLGGIFLLGESPSPNMLIGGGIILCGVGIIVFERPPKVKTSII